MLISLPNLAIPCTLLSDDISVSPAMRISDPISAESSTRRPRLTRASSATLSRPPIKLGPETDIVTVNACLDILVPPPILQEPRAETLDPKTTISDAVVRCPIFISPNDDMVEPI